jgi:hypothetical protein
VICTKTDHNFYNFFAPFFQPEKFKNE